MLECDVYYAILSRCIRQDAQSVSTTVRFVRDELWIVELWVLRLVAVDTILNLAPELPDQTLHRPGSSIA